MLIDQPTAAILTPTRSDPRPYLRATGIRHAILGGGLLWLAARSVLVLIAIIAHLASPQSAVFFQRRDWLAALYFNWDSFYFAGIAEHGYFSAVSLPTWIAFFPGYPAAARALAFVTAGQNPSVAQFVTSLAVVAAVASLITVILFWHIVEDAYSSRIALAATVLFVAGPYSLFLAASYSESLFLAFALGAWLMASRGRWLSAGILTAAASFTRINGLFLVLAIIVVFVVQRRRRGETYRLETLALAALGGLGIGGYFLYLFARTGDIQAWSHAQLLGWHRAITVPWMTLWATADSALHARFAATRIQSTLEIVFAVLFLLALVIFIRRRMWAESVLVGVTLVCMITSSTYISVARTSLVLFPLPILVATALTSPGRKWIYWLVLIAGFVLFLFNARQFALGHWAD